MTTDAPRTADAFDPRKVTDTTTHHTPEAAQTATAPADTTTVDGDVYRARRRRAAIIAAVAVAASWYLWTAEPWAAVQATTQASTGAVVATDQGQHAAVDADMTTARGWLTTHGTLDGIALDGAQVAARGRTMYAARIIDGACTVYGILNGTDLVPAVDTTGQACAGQIVAVQAQLDQAAYTATTTAETQARDTLTAAADTVTAYTARNYVDGVPSTTGLPAVVGGALVVTNTGQYVVLRASYPAVCLEMHVTAAGETSPPTTCP